MTTVKSRELGLIVQGGPDILSPELKRAVLKIIQEAEDAAEPGRVQTTGWCYWMPFPGVRYYSYDDHPSPVEGVKRAPESRPE